MRNRSFVTSSICLVAVMLTGALAGCSAEADNEASASASVTSALSGFDASVKRGEKLFKSETFGGNGRTCVTCHSIGSGTLTLEQMGARFQSNPSDPLFRPIDSDDGSGGSYRRLLSEATFKVTVDLPPWLRLKDQPTVRKVSLFRTALTTNDSPALDPLLMWDTRAPNLNEQALDAVHTHAQPTVQPTPQQLTDIANYQKDKLFSDPTLDAWAHGAPEPEVPYGRTASEKRGREFFTQSGMCGFCHTSFALPENRISALLNGGPNDVLLRLAPARAGELPGEANEFHPMKQWVYTDPSSGAETEFTSNDPGATLVNSDPFLIAGGMASFKIPNIRNIKHTAPYFHDGSAKTLEDVVDHYSVLFGDPTFRDNFAVPLGGDFMRPLTTTEKKDIVAFMKLL